MMADATAAAETSGKHVKPLNSLLVKPAGPRCNLGCEYCFYLQKQDLWGHQVPYRMDDSILRSLVRQMMREGAPQISFGWQGGEPTLMGIPFFEQAVEYQIRFGSAGQLVGNGLQTNGILINQEWAKFLSDARFLVGLSLDGPEHVHDHYRRYVHGQPSWAKVVKARDILLDQGVEVNALSVVTDYSARFAREIYDFHKTGGMTYMQFIPCCEPDPLDRVQVAHYSVSPDAYGQFLCEIFDLWLADFQAGRPMTSIRWFDSLLYTFVDLPAPECTLLPECGTYLVVEHNGDVFSCDFYVEPSGRLGNVGTDHLSDMLNSTLQRQFGLRKTQRAKLCRECQWLSHCYGGCPKNRLLGLVPDGLDYFCPAYIRFFEHAGDAFAQLAKKFKLHHRRLAF